MQIWLICNRDNFYIWCTISQRMIMSGNIDPEIRDKCASWRRSWLPYFPMLLGSCPMKMDLVSDLVKWISQSIENPSFESMYQINQWMTSRRNLGVLHKPYSMAWGNLGKKCNSRSTPLDVTSHTRLVLQQIMNSPFLSHPEDELLLASCAMLAIYLGTWCLMAMPQNDFHCLWPVVSIWSW